MAGSAAEQRLTDPERIWDEAATRLRAEIGEGPFSSYIAPSAVRADASGRLVLVTPTAYARDWVRRNALRRMNELWLGLDGLSRRLDVRCRAEFGSPAPAISGSASQTQTPAAHPRATVAPVADGPRAVRAAGLQDRLTSTPSWKARATPSPWPSPNRPPAGPRGISTRCSCAAPTATARPTC
nr:DnaA N-terminal domain-containing protein [Brevundimonas denitrificans]